MREPMPPEPPLQPLPLDSWHRARGARMVPFAGYAMPVVYEGTNPAGGAGGIIAEHLWTRSHAGLFDVSHMGQLLVSGSGAATALEALLPGDFAALEPGQMRYSVLLAADGGILDDVIVTNARTDGDEAFAIVVNGATKWDDIAHLREHLPDAITLNHLADHALFALQGPAAAAALDRVLPGLAGRLTFMQSAGVAWEGVRVGVSRSGYTGEDGFELSIPASHAEALAARLIADPQVRPIGLGARDSLRLEAGLPLYGHDLTPATDPISAGLGFAIGKRRRAQGGFPGADRILALLAAGAPTRRVGLALEGRAAAREGAEIFAGEARVGPKVGVLTSGGFAPSLGHAIAMGYVAAAHAAPGTGLTIEVRGKRLPATVTALPFVPHRYHR